MVNGRKESKHYYDLVKMNVSHYSGGGGGDDEDAADDNDAEEKRMVVSKMKKEVYDSTLLYTCSQNDVVK